MEVLLVQDGKMIADTLTSTSKIIFIAICLCILLALSGCYTTGNILHEGDYTAVMDEDGNRVWIKCLKGTIEIERNE